MRIYMEHIRILRLSVVQDICVSLVVLMRQIYAKGVDASGKIVHDSGEYCPSSAFFTYMEPYYYNNMFSIRLSAPLHIVRMMS